MSSHRYSAEEKAFLKDNAFGRSRKELTDMFNARFGLQMTVSQIASKAEYHRFNNGINSKFVSGRCGKSIYTQEQIDFVVSKLEGCSYQELTDMLNSQFGTQFSVKQIERLIRRKHIGNKRDTKFKHNCESPKRVPIGSEYESDGYIRVKYAEPNKWKHKHVYVWEASYGPVPKNYCIVFGDGDKRNFNLDNLILVSRRQLVGLNRERLVGLSVEITKAGMLMVDLRQKISERKKQISNRIS